MATTAEANTSGSAPLVDSEGALQTSKADESQPDQSSLQPAAATDPVDAHDKGAADPDAQATVTDFLDFTEYLPADMTRSLILIGKLDRTYNDASRHVDELTKTWGQLPALPPDQRPAPVQLRADISENLNQAMGSRVSAYAEASRMAEYVNRHVNRAKTILAKLQTMRDNFSAEGPKSPVQTRSPQMSKAPKITLHVDKDGQEIRRPPRITVPGEVLAPYEIDLNMYSSASDDETEDDEMSVSSRVTPAPRIKVIKGPKLPGQKVPKPPRAPRHTPSGIPMLSTSYALSQLKPPPENAVPGSADAPWLQLTHYELAKLRKRMKKNAVWTPSETMIARELNSLGRGVEAYRAAKKKAEEEGKPFEAAVPARVGDGETSTQHPLEGAIDPNALNAEEIQLSNRGMKLNEQKKLKREQLAQQAAKDAEESARKMAAEAARMFSNHEASPSVASSVQGQAAEPGPSQTQTQAKPPGRSRSKKRKRDSMSEAGPEIKPEIVETPTSNAPARPQLKRTKTETPVPPPQLTPRPPSVPPHHETPVPPPHLGQPAAVGVKSTTPVPPPSLLSSSETSSVSGARHAASKSHSPVSGTSPVPPPVLPSSSSVTTTVPTKPPAEMHTPLPSKTTTPILPPARDFGRRETRSDSKNLTLQPMTTRSRQSASQPGTPATTPGPEPHATQSAPSRRPVSRGKAGSQEPPTTLASERPRRTSTARNTPAPEPRQPSKRAKRPVPGIVPTHSTGKSAVGKRKAAPKKRTRGGTKKAATNQPVEQEVEVEVDDEGNVIDPDEPRYCLCNRVSFGTMISCDNIDSCKYEWFHLECVNLSEPPARTTKWYCPECREALGLGERGEVTARGVKL